MNPPRSPTRRHGRKAHTHNYYFGILFPIALSTFVLLWEGTVMEKLSNMSSLLGNQEKEEKMILPASGMVVPSESWRRKSVDDIADTADTVGWEETGYEKRRDRHHHHHHDHDHLQHRLDDRRHGERHDHGGKDVKSHNGSHDGSHGSKDERHSHGVRGNAREEISNMGDASGENHAIADIHPKTATSATSATSAAAADAPNMIPQSQGRNNHFPRMALFSPDNKDQSGKLNDMKASPISEDAKENKGKRKIKLHKREVEQQLRLRDSEDFSYRDPLYEGECVPMQPWQETSFPNCNSLHELDFYGKSRKNEFAFYAAGGYNQIFLVDNTGTTGNKHGREVDPKMVVKILEYGTEYSDRNYDRVRRDGLILERLSRSPYIMDTYGFCGFAVVVPLADGGTLSSHLRKWNNGRIDLSPMTRMGYAVEVAEGLAAVHDIDGEGLSSVAHGDLKENQFLFSDGKLQLGDFNRGRFLRRNSTDPTTACTYEIGKNDAKFRSPEEYLYLPQTSAIDIWALGSILYSILTSEEVWSDYRTSEAQDLIAEGARPKIPKEYLMSDDEVDKALIEAMDMCFVVDPKKRAKADEVRDFLKRTFEELSQKQR